jgi:hypothetical protein
MRMIKSLSLLLLIFCIAGCEKTESFNNTEDKVGNSRVTRFPVFDMEGEEYVVLLKGGTYTEPGVKAHEGTTEIPVTTTGSVNTNVAGVYVLTYSAVNKDGFAASVSRTVIVTPGTEVPGTDLSGHYDYVGSSTFTATVTKLGNGAYITDNAWSGLTVIPMIFFSLDGLSITVPDQTTGYGGANGTGTYTPATGRLVFVLNLTDQSISNSTRTWQRQ